MTTRWIVRSICSIALVVAVCLAWVTTSQVADAGNASVSAGVDLVLLANSAAEDKKEKEGPEFISSRKCKMCHIKEYKAWENPYKARDEEEKAKKFEEGELPGHSIALESLKPGKRVEAKKAAKLDPQKDYTNDPECLKCHTTGFGKKGGFQLVDDEKEMEKMYKYYGHVGCESCHGAGEPYIDFHKKIRMKKMEYTVEEMREAGTIDPDAEVCKQCHNEKSPTYKEFKYEEAVKRGVHKTYELKYRKK